MKHFTQGVGRACPTRHLPQRRSTPAAASFGEKDEVALTLSRCLFSSGAVPRQPQTYGGAAWRVGVKHFIAAGRPESLFWGHFVAGLVHIR